MLVKRSRPNPTVPDAIVPEGGAGQQEIERLDQGTVGAPVGVERVVGARSVHRGQVGLDVGPSEGVDRLFGIPDHHQPGLVEDGPDHLPLDRVRVLGLVHQRHRIAAAQERPGVITCVGVGEGIPGLHQDVVEGDGPGHQESPSHELPHVPGQSSPHPGSITGTVRFGDDPGIGRRGQGLADRFEVGGADRLDVPSGPVREAVQHEVSGSPSQQELVQIMRLELPRQARAEPQLEQDSPGETVDGEYLRPVEARHRPVQPLRIPVPVGRRRADQHSHMLVDFDPAGIPPEGPEGADHPASHPILELGSGRSREGDDQDLLHGQTVGGHQAGDRGRDGEGLAGSGAGLDDGAALTEG